MRYRNLGRSGLLVSELCLGTNMFGGEGLDYWKDLGGLDQEGANKCVAAAVEGGVNFIDTSDRYANGGSEVAVGQAVKDLGIDRSSIVICSKGGMNVKPGPNGGGGSRARLIDACENSLRRLDTDYIDVYLLHMFDPITPLEETLRALDDLVRSGKVRYVGCSNFEAWELMKATGISEYERLARFEVVQNQWSIATRGSERDLAKVAHSEGIGLMPWGALMGGVLTGKYRRDGSAEDSGRFGGAVPANYDREKIHDIVDTMRDVAQAHDVSPAEIALAFLLNNPATASVIFGSTKPDQVKANLRASGLALSEVELARLSGVSANPVDPYLTMLDGMRNHRRQWQ